MQLHFAFSPQLITNQLFLITSPKKIRSSASDAPLPAKPFGFQFLAPQCRIGAYSAYQFKGDRISSQLPESNRRTRLCPFSCCVSAGLPRQGEKMLLYSLMRKKPDNFLSRHCYYSMSCRRGCKEKPPFLQIFFSFCCGQQNAFLLRKFFYHFTVYPPLNAKLSFTACTCALLYPHSYIQFTKAHFFSLDFMSESFSSCSLFFTLK